MYVYVIKPLKRKEINIENYISTNLENYIRNPHYGIFNQLTIRETMRITIHAHIHMHIYIAHNGRLHCEIYIYIYTYYYIEQLLI